MATKPISSQVLTLERLHKLLDPGRVFYRPAVDDVLERGELAEIQALLQGARDVKAKYGEHRRLSSRSSRRPPRRPSKWTPGGQTHCPSATRGSTISSTASR